MQQSQLVDHPLETLAVFGAVDGVRAGADNRHTFRFKGTRQFQRGLAAKLDNDALRLLNADNFQHIFQGHRLKVEAVGSVVVCRDGLRVAVDHYSLVTVFAHGQRRVHTAVIELDTLADAVGAATQHHNLVFAGGL